MSILYNPKDLNDPALALKSDQDIEQFRALAKALDVGDGSLIWRAQETILRARFRLAEEIE